MYRRVLITVGLGLTLLAGCGPLNPGTIITTSSNANLRVLNGSPGATGTNAFSATLDSATGPALATNLAYKNVAPYASITAANHSVVITSTTSAFQPLTCGVGVLQPGFNYTVVVAGNPNSTSPSTGLQCQVFQEPPYAGTTTTGNFALHNASPEANANGDSILTIGTFPAASPTSFGALIGSSPMFNATPTQTITTFTSALSLNASSTGIGFWVTPQHVTPATGNLLATLLPSQAVAASNSQPVSDPQNLFPTSNLVNLSIYAVDAPAGSPTVFNLVGVFEGV